ncbi:hypothetical protein GCM10012289_58220 [Nonomuraea cavernae]|uniref:Uncharacterized protein n=2 Tax=Nonomuraea cavernae TaxID=2045107 RepID=A0A918DP60_9ACTN|nr:hypothetical protein GCM10012289_58220 [Nonomuraea cavernae]
MVAVIVLLLNDHLLKQAHPGFVTGKLSDVAGLVVAPPLLALLLWRRADLTATLLTGALFTLVKTTETGAETASHLWTLVAGPSRVLADPTDLLALPALGLAWWIRRRTLLTGSGRWRPLVTMPLALLAVVATSAAPPPPSADSVLVDGERVIVHTYEGFESDSGVTGMVSEDGGATWSEWYPRRERAPQSAACVPGRPQRCYRVLDETTVTESDDGGVTWRESWKPAAGGPGAPQRLRALAVQARPGGHVVVVAGGVDGILVRDVSGAWRQAGWPLFAPPRAEPADPVREERGIAFFLAVTVLLGALGIGLRQLRAPYTVFAVVGLGGLLYTTSQAVHTSGIDPGGLLIGGSLTLIGILMCLVLAAAGRIRPTAALVGLGAAPLVFAAVYGPFYGWTQGVPASYGVAVAAAVVLSTGVVAAGGLLIRRDAYLTGSSTSSPT